MTRCGVVVLAGKPNVGKSTLLNALVGEHLAIVSPKPQSTRLPVVGLLTRADTQFIFTDSPGLLEPEYQLHEAMRAAALRAIADAEVIAYLHPLSEYPAPPLAQVGKLGRPPRAPVVTVYTKADLAASSTDLYRLLPTSTVAVSAITGQGLEDLLSTLRAQLPESPFHYDPDAMATQPMRFLPPSSCARRRSSCCTKSCPTAWPSRSTSSEKVRSRCIFEPWSTSSAPARRES